MITASGDSRVTVAGAWLRRFKVDELPQLVNVLVGDMSLIGPRPEVPEFVDHDDNLWREVLGVRAGITDLASLTFRDEERFLAPLPTPPPIIGRSSCRKNSGSICNISDHDRCRGI